MREFFPSDHPGVMRQIEILKERIAELEAELDGLCISGWGGKSAYQWSEECKKRESVIDANERISEGYAMRAERAEAERDKLREACEALVSEWEDGQPWPGGFEKVYDKAKEALGHD